MHDPVMADLNRYLDEQDAIEMLDEYMAEHGRHPCEGCDENCRRCGARKVKYLRRGI